jgi:hypothetical protein
LDSWLKLAEKTERDLIDYGQKKGLFELKDRKPLAYLRSVRDCLLHKILKEENSSLLWSRFQFAISKLSTKSPEFLLSGEDHLTVT